MRPLPDHIAGLLADHDCVIVPALGAFLASREPARPDVSGRRLLPPRRRIAFNVFLRQNDGLLAQRLVETEHFTYPEAVRHVEHFSAGVLRKLESGEPVNIARVGILSMGNDSAIRFSPESESMLDPETFGLGTVSLPQPVAAGRRTGVPVSVTEPAVSSPARPRRPLAKYQLQQLLSAAAVAGALLWFSFNVYLVTRDSGQQASLPSLDSVRPERTTTDTANRPKVLSTVPTKPETVYVASVAPVKAPEASTVTTPAPEPAIPPAADQRFFVIAGAFKQSGNAEALVRELRDRGFSHARIIDTVGSLMYVCYDGFPEAAAAESLLTDLRSRQEKGWIYRN
jgi:cell division septation protein DedD